MSKRKRSERNTEQRYTPPVDTNQITWQLTEKLRGRCPICSLLGDIEAIQAGPHDIGLKMQRFGGKTPDGHGIMEYTVVTDPEENNLYRDLLITKLQEALAVLGGEPVQGVRFTRGEPDPLLGLVLKWRNRKKNVTQLESALDNFIDQYELDDVFGEIESYREMERSDYGSSEEFGEAKDEQWGVILDKLEETAHDGTKEED